MTNPILKKPVLLPSGLRAAPPVTSAIFGSSGGNRQVERIHFQGKYADHRYHVAIARKVSWFARFLFPHISMQILANGKEETVWVNVASLQKRFNTKDELEHIKQYFQPKDYDRLVVDRVYRAMHSENSKISRKDVSLLVSASAEEARKLTTDDPILKRKADRNYARTMLISKTGCYALMTSTKKGDRLLGQGGFKKAKIAIDLSTGEKRVVTIGREEKRCTSLEAEFKVMKSINSNNVVSADIFAKSSYDKNHKKYTKSYCIMDYYDGGDLTKLNTSKLSPSSALTLMKDCATGLRYIHDQNRVHCDIKPGNIFLKKNKKEVLHATIADVGCLSSVNEHKRLETSGTELYFSPERHRIKLPVQLKTWITKNERGYKVNATWVSLEAKELNDVATKLKNYEKKKFELEDKNIRTPEEELTLQQTIQNIETSTSKLAQRKQPIIQKDLNDLLKTIKTLALYEFNQAKSERLLEESPEEPTEKIASISKAGDVWALGITFLMTVLPFNKEEKSSLTQEMGTKARQQDDMEFNKILEEQLEKCPEAFHGVIRGMLAWKDNQRLTMDQVVQELNRIHV